MQVVVGEISGRKAGYVSAPHDHRAGFAQIGDRDAVLFGVGKGESLHAIGRRPAGIIDVDLDRDRHAMENAQRRAATDRLVGPIRTGDRFLGQVVYYGVEARVHRVQPRQTVLGRLAA